MRRGSCAASVAVGHHGRMFTPPEAGDRGAAGAPGWSMLTVPLIVLVLLTGLVAQISETVYQQETTSWRAQADAQDLVDMAIACPLLAAAAWSACRGSL